MIMELLGTTALLICLGLLAASLALGMILAVVFMVVFVLGMLSTTYYTISDLVYALIRRLRHGTT